MRILLNTSRRGCRFMLNMLQYIIQLSFFMSGGKLSPLQEKILRDFPKDPDTATSKFNLDAQKTIYAVCPNPSCHKTYKPHYRGSSPIPEYPKYCDNKQFVNGSKCGTRINQTQFGQGNRYRGCHQTICIIQPSQILWVALSLGQIMCVAWMQPGIPSSRSHQGTSEIATDIFDGEFLRTFKGPDGKLFALRWRARTLRSESVC